MQVTLLAGDVAEPRRFARPLVGGVVVALVVSLLTVTAMFLAAPEGADSRNLLAEAATALWGPPGGSLVAATVAIAVLGGLHTMTLTGPRLYQTATEGGQWLAPFAR